MTPQPTVFVIDDDAGVREYLTFVLRSADMHVADFSSGVSFVEQFDSDQPGCLVCDIHMAGMNGLDLQSRLAQRGSTLPIIFVTGYADVADAVSALKTGAMDYLQKPIASEALLQSVRRALASDAQQRALRLSETQAELRLLTLTAGEREVLDLLIEGNANKTIATKLNLTHKAVETRRARVMKKIGVKSLPELFRKVLTFSSPSKSLSHP